MFNAVLRTLTRTGLRRGFSGSRPWMTTAFVAVGLRTIRRMANPKPEVVYRSRVRVGDRFTITSRPPRAR